MDVVFLNQRLFEKLEELMNTMRIKKMDNLLKTSENIFVAHSATSSGTIKCSGLFKQTAALHRLLAFLTLFFLFSA